MSKEINIAEQTYNNKSGAARGLKRHLERVTDAVPGTLEIYELKNKRWGIRAIAVKAPKSAPEVEQFADVAPAKKSKRVKKEAAEILHKSEVERPTKRVWHIADSMPSAARKDVLEACRKKGIAFHTARTQYQLWRSFNPRKA